MIMTEKTCIKPNDRKL